MKNQLTYLVTGAGGFLGSHICRALIDKDLKVKGLARNHYPHIQEIGVNMAQIDLSNNQDQKKLEDFLQDVDIIFHTASKVAMWGNWKDFYQSNVQGTKNLIQAAKQAGIKYFIYTSTPSVVFQWDDIKGADEKTDYAQNSKSRYARSKIIAEKMVIDSTTEDFHTISLRPHLIFGPSDKNIIPRLIESAKKKKLKIIGNGDNQVDVLYIDNAVEAHLKASQALIEKKDQVSGQAYFIGQGPIKLWPFINQILTINNIDPITKKVSFPIAYCIGALIETILQVFRIYNIHPPMTRFVALQLAKDHYFSHEKSQNDLGFTPIIGIDQALKETFKN